MPRANSANRSIWLPLYVVALTLGLASPLGAADEPEEPDYAFITGGPYTQKRTSPQFIYAGQWGRRNSLVADTDFRQSEYGMLLRSEYGMTDRWELDLIFSAAGARDRLGDTTLSSEFGLADTVLGARYRFLDESFAPFTLTMGPQVILPTGNPLLGTGFEATGVAWDVSAAKDWGGPVFLFTSLNYSLFPSVGDPEVGSPRDFNLHSVFGAVALGLRPLEKTRGDNHHDIHAFLEYGVGREQTLETGPMGATKVSETVSVFAPGIRYGLLTKKAKLLEFGVAFPVGLNDATPRFGVIVQIQLENLFGYQGD